MIIVAFVLFFYSNIIAFGYKTIEYFYHINKKTGLNHIPQPCYQLSSFILCYYRAPLARLQLFEKVVAFVVYEDESG